MQPPSDGGADRRSDAELVALAREGVQGAFGTLVQRYQGLAIARAFSLLSDRGEAEDAAQDAFLRAYRSLGQLRQPGSFGSWLLQTVANVARRASRKRAKRPGPLSEAEPARGPEPHGEVLDAVAALPEGYQQVVHLHYSQGHTCAEIGQMLGLKIGSVTSRLTRARQMLRKLLSDEQGNA
jgi:RNA polymerase sigma-70 factor (ECF subfamily)